MFPTIDSVLDDDTCDRDRMQSVTYQKGEKNKGPAMRSLYLKLGLMSKGREGWDTRHARL